MILELHACFGRMIPYSVYQHEPIAHGMQKNLIVLVFGLLMYSFAIADEACVCKTYPKGPQSSEKIINSLKKSELNFVQSFETDQVRGIREASYFYCDNDQGFLLVILHNKTLLYKNVPLRTWFEFKYADSFDSYYTDEIKYKFIAI